MFLKPEFKEEAIKEMAKAGAKLSLHFRDPWTKELRATTIQIEKFGGKTRFLQLLALVGDHPLVDISTCGDLNGIVYMGRPDQYKWNEARWEKEIRAVVG